MSRAPNETRRKRISEIRERIEAEIASLEKLEVAYSEKSFQFKKDAITHKQQGRVKQALDSLKLAISYERLANNQIDRITTLTNNLMKLDSTNHKLFLRSFPPEYTKNTKNVDPSVKPNDNSIERFYIRKYGLSPYPALPPPPPPPPPPAANNNNNSNDEDAPGCLRDAFGRCIAGLKARFTKKNNKNKKNGGGRRKKGKSMKARRRN